MARRSGSRSSRSERRAERHRGERAREHGHPEPRPAPLRARAVTPDPDSAGQGVALEATPSLPLRKSGVSKPMLLLGAALLILLGVYLLSRQRDRALTDPAPVREAAPTSAPSEK